MEKLAEMAPGRHTQNSLERLHVPSGLGNPGWNPKEELGWGTEGILGLPFCHWKLTCKVMELSYVDKAMLCVNNEQFKLVIEGPGRVQVPGNPQPTSLPRKGPTTQQRDQNSRFHVGTAVTFQSKSVINFNRISENWPKNLELICFCSRYSLK